MIRKKSPVLVLLCFMTACSANQPPKRKINLSTPSASRTTTKVDTNSGWTFEKVVDSKLVFKNNRVFDTRLFHLKYIGQITTAGKSPYFIFSGRACQECDANISVYIHSPSDGQLVVANGQNRYLYPGTMKDYQTNSVLMVSRAFYGQVMNNTKGVIWYEKRFLDGGETDSLIYLARLENNSLTDTVYADNGTLTETLKLARQGLCKEIPGKTYTSEP